MKLLKQRSTKITVWLGMLLSILILMAFGGMARPVYAGGPLADSGPNLKTECGGDPMEITIEMREPGGLGNMYSFKVSERPWNAAEYRTNVETVVIGSGVKTICPYAFKDMTKLKTVFLPKSITSIGAGAFDGCTQLKKIFYFGTQAELTSIIPSSSPLFLISVACDKGLTAVNLSTSDSKPLTAKWSYRFTTLYNTLSLLENANQLIWSNKSGLTSYLDLDKDGNDDLHACFYPSSSLVDSDQESNLLGKLYNLTISSPDPVKQGLMEEDYSYFSKLTFVFPKKFNGDKGKYTIDLTSGSTVIKDANIRTYLDRTFSGAYNKEHSIKISDSSATGVTYDIDMDGKGDVHFEYSATGLTITKLNTCSLKADTSLVLKTATKNDLNAVLDEYYGTVTLKIIAPKPTATPTPTPTPTPALAPDGTAFGKGASVAAAEAAIATLPNDNDPKGSTYAPMRARSTKQTNKAIYLTWKKAPGAKKYVIYGSLCGTKYKMVKIAETTKKKYTVKKINKKKLKKAKYYKFMIVAIDGSNKVVSTSKIVHAATDGGKYGNYKSITTKAEKLEDANELDLDVGKKFKLKGKGVKDPMKTKFKQHRKICYESTDPSVATVSKNGVVKGISEGDCYVYVYSQNGICVRIKVEVDA